MSYSYEKFTQVEYFQVIMDRLEEFHRLPSGLKTVLKPDLEKWAYNMYVSGLPVEDAFVAVRSFIALFQKHFCEG
jgi:hypothetical protein